MGLDLERGSFLMSDPHVAPAQYLALATWQPRFPKKQEKVRIVMALRASILRSRHHHEILELGIREGPFMSHTLRLRFAYVRMLHRIRKHVSSLYRPREDALQASR